MSARPDHYPTCGDCLGCLAKTHALLRTPAGGTLLPGPRPTAAALEKHARRFGPAQVAETAAEYGLSVTVEREAKVRKVSGPSLRQRVATLVADGYGVDTIAEIENLTPWRARRLVAEVSS